MKKMKFLLPIIFISFFILGNLNAAILTFDDHPDAVQNSVGEIGTYNGFEFHSDSGSTDQLDWIDTVGSTWPYGAISGEFTMLNNYGGSGLINAVGDIDFTFNGLYARTWGIDIDRAVNITGFNNGVEVASTDYTLTSSWGYFSGWGGILIDELHLNLGDYFLVDNLALNEVPVPSTIFLLGIGLLGLAGISRRNQ